MLSTLENTLLERKGLDPKGGGGGAGAVLGIAWGRSIVAKENFKRPEIWFCGGSWVFIDKIMQETIAEILCNHLTKTTTIKILLIEST